MGLTLLVMGGNSKLLPSLHLRQEFLRKNVKLYCTSVFYKPECGFYTWKGKTGGLN